MLLNVLVVEDDRKTAESLAGQLTVLGHTVATAYGPRMAIQRLGQVIPDVILMDINMPGVNGLEIVRFLRRDPVTARVPVIIISANDTLDMIQAAMEAGANHYIVKPPTIEDLEEALERVMRPASPPDESTSNT